MFSSSIAYNISFNLTKSINLKNKIKIKEFTLSSNIN